LSSETSRPATEFDGFRFYNLRKIPGNENKHQFVVTSSDSLNFGHGNHACPGRFFASNEIKVVLIELLRNWDFRFLEGKGRPENVLRGLVCGPVRPDTKGVMEFRRKKV
jgi:cytochrome P450